MGTDRVNVGAVSLLVATLQKRATWTSTPLVSRRMSVHPAAVLSEPRLRFITWATMTSPAVVPAGIGMVSVVIPVADELPWYAGGGAAVQVWPTAKPEG